MTKAVVVIMGSIQREGTALIKSVGEVYNVSIGFNSSDFFFKIKGKTLKDLPFEVTEVALPKTAYASHDEKQEFIRDFTTGPFDTKEYGCIYSLGFTAINNVSNQFTIDASGIIINTEGHKILKITADFFRNIAKSFYFQIEQNGNKIFEENMTSNSWERFPLDRSFGIMAKKNDRITFIVSGTCQKNIGLLTYNEFHVAVQNFNVQISSVVSENSLTNFATKTYPEVNFALATLYNPSALSAIKNESLKTNYSLAPFMNVYTENTFPVMYKIGNKNISNIFVPMPYVAYIFDSIAKFANYTIHKSIFKHPELKRLVLFNNFIENTYDTFMEGVPFVLDPIWHPKDHVSKMDITEFISILDLFAAKMLIDSVTKTIDIVFIKDILTSDVASDTKLRLLSPPSILYSEQNEGYKLSFDPQEGYSNDYVKDFSDLNYKGELNYWESFPEEANLKDCYYVKAKRAYYVLEYDAGKNEKTWKLFSFIRKSIEKEAEQQVSTSVKIAPLLSGQGVSFIDNPDKYTDPNIFPYLIGRVSLAKQTCIIKNAVETIENDTVMALSIYRGFRPMPNNDSLLPLVSHDVYNDVNGEKHPLDTIALRWEGEYGLYETFWKPVLDWLTMRAKVIELEIPYMSIREYNNLAQLRIHRINEQNYLITEIKAEISDDAAKKIVLKALTV